VSDGLWPFTATFILHKNLFLFGSTFLLILCERITLLKERSEPMEFTSETMYKDLIKFSYCSFDRIVIRGHVPVLQGNDGGGVVSWARSFDPDIILDKSWFDSFTSKFHINVKKFAQENNISIIQVNQSQDKNEIAKKYLPKDKDFIGVYCIIKAREMTSSFASQKSFHNTNTQHRNITRQIRCVDHFYFYLLDKYWGPISIRFSSHLPFNVKVFLNGNRWLARETPHQGLSVKAKDNAIIDCDAPSALQSIADTLDERKVRSVCEHWAYRLLPVLTYQERNKSKFQYQWFLHQVEYAHNMVFKSSRSLTKLFHRHIAVNYEYLHTQQIQRFFGHRYKPSHDNECALRIHRKSQAVTVMKMHSRGCSLKQYNKFLRLFRSEMTVNNVRDLKIHKSLSNFNKLKERMESILCSFQETQSAVHQATCTRGELAALAKGGNVGRSHVAGIRLDNERIMKIVALLPRLAHLPDGFRIADLRDLISNVTQNNYASSQISYDLRKLRAKNIIECIPGRKRYRLNYRGATLTAILPPLADKLCNSLIGLALFPTKCNMPEKLRTPLDHFYYNIEKEISSLTKTLNLVNNTC